MAQQEVSERRACGLMEIDRGSVRYQPRALNDEELRAHLRELAGQRKRFGYRRLWALLRREKHPDGGPRWVVNHKRVHRIYREEGLALRRKIAKKLRAAARTPRMLPVCANQVWTMDFTQDNLSRGRKFRTLNLMDGYTREALAIEVDSSLPGARVVRVLEALQQMRGVPGKIMVDNGPEFISQALDRWAYQNGVQLHFIQPGKPTQNAYIESFNGKFRDECLEQSWFVSLADARQQIEAWRVDYNTVRPHSSLGYRTPEEFAREEAAGTGGGKAAPWKSTNHFSTALGNPANHAGFPLSHRPGDGELSILAVPLQPPDATL